MKSTIALINPYPRIDAVFAPLAEELNLTVKKYSGIKPMADDLNSKVLPVKELALVMVTGTSEEKDPGQYRKNMSLLAQLAKHSKLKDMPVLFLGYRGCAELGSSCIESGAEYLDLPVKKSVLMEKIRNLIDGTGRGYKNKRGFESAPIGRKAPAPKAAESERRLATVMFADISGFTAMSEKIDPEDVTRVMNGCFKMMEKIISEHGGHIDKFIGDCVMVLFGVPKAIENAPLQAVNTAIEMRNGLYEYNKTLSAVNADHDLPLLDIHIGLNTGPVLAGQVGGKNRKDYTVMGDAVNLASRIEGASEKGQILVGPDTFRATQGEFEYKALAPVSLKGKADPVPVYEVLSVKETASRRRRTGKRAAPGTGPERMIYSEMVGRDAEMNQLRHIVTGLVMGTGGIVNVIGEAGIGKSRLMAELKADPAMKQAAILEGQAISMGRNLPFHPIIDLMKNWAEIREDDSEQMSFAKLDRAVRGVHPEEADEIIPFVATLIGMKLSGKYAERVKGIEGEALEKLIFKNIRELLIKGSELRPMIIRIEDLHWADTSSIELLSSLFRLARTHRILFLNFFRPNYVETGDRVLKTLKEEFTDKYTEIPLQPLNTSESGMLISNLLDIKGLPQSLKDQITERAGGNPFFIEEVVRSLIDEGAVVKKGDSFTVTAKINTVTVPLTINEVLMSRIDRLADETKLLIKTASVIGRYFFYKIISQVAHNISDIDKRLGYLEDIQLIRERKRMDEIEYLFKHALAQEAAYESLLLQKRKELHLHVAQAIENVFAGRLHEFYGMLAYHYSKGDNLDKAEEFMLKAGEEAMKSSASSEALNYYKDALKLYRQKSGKYADPEKVKKIEINIALSLYYKGEMAEAVDYFDRVLSYFGLTLPKNPLRRIYYFISAFIDMLLAIYFPSMKFKKEPPRPDLKLIELHHYKLHGCGFFNTKKMFFDSFNPNTWVSNFIPEKIQNSLGFFSQISMLFSYTGLSERISRKVLSIARTLIEKSGPEERLSYIHTKQMHNQYFGYWDEITLDQDLVEENIKIGSLSFSSLKILWNFILLTNQGNRLQSERCIERIRKIAEEFNHEMSRILELYMTGYLFWKYRDSHDLLDPVNKGLPLSEKSNAHMVTIMLYNLMAQHSVFSGEFDKAAKSIQAIEMIRAHTSFVPLINGFYLMAKLAIAMVQAEESFAAGKMDRSLLKRALNSARACVKNSNKNALDRVEAYRFMGTCFWYAGKPKKALRWWKKSIDEGERLGARLELSRTYFEVGKRIFPFKKGHKLMETVFRGITATEYLEKARVMFSKMGLEHDLAELEKII
ncbi:MAG: AAA family ATPase [Spirochaetes bacterium]|nr:AAA family ATPase [Spirochaetota bacterium]